MLGPFSEGTRVATATTLDVAGLVGTDTDHHLRVTAVTGSGSASAAAVTASSVIMVGGTAAIYVDGSTTYVAHSFETPGDFPTGLTANRAIDVEYLLVGGGGGGGAHVGGGGGGGGVLTNVGGTALALPSGDHAIVVGDGGAGGSNTGDNNGTTIFDANDRAVQAENGGDTQLGTGLGDAGADLIAVGGGSGGSWDYDAPRVGGSGGGSATSTAAGGTPGQGFSGGTRSIIHSARIGSGAERPDPGSCR